MFSNLICILKNFFLIKTLVENKIPSHEHLACWQVWDEKCQHLFCLFQVEMFGVTQNQGGDDLLLEFLEIEKQLFQNLGLHFR